MGVYLTPIVIKRVLTLRSLGGKLLAVDANNYLYQFLSLIRMRDGSPLRDSRGNITSHLVGLLHRTTRLICDYKISLVFVFDGEPPEMKRRELERRRKAREKALQEWRKALEEGDVAAAFSKAVMTSRLTEPMVEDAKRLLELLGIPYVQAPGEAEAQSAYMAMRGEVWAASSKDYDCLLFGAPRLVRFLTITGKEFLPSKGVTRPLKPELIDLQRFLSHHGITREQLVDLAILVGTDFNDGVKGIGPKTALKLIRKHGSLENLPADLRESLPKNYEEVRRIFLHPKVTSEYTLHYGELKEEALYEFLCGERGFSKRRVKTVVEKMRRFYSWRRQRRLKEWLPETR
ncbi:flap endonuclease-1 [Candidatus Bathyarchaeota archaeon]|nr:MAG: flap endonuclease-1 [Candidatus Bathyarchaeota archaeon]RJS77368.1 MAG: flap endonuclease-1 [Candidatus Bathyarchaeota archaeon]